jgi:hypothetical protein
MRCIQPVIGPAVSGSGVDTQISFFALLVRKGATPCSPHQMHPHNLGGGSTNALTVDTICNEVQTAQTLTERLT